MSIPFEMYSMYKHFLKRFFDFIISLCALIVLGPILLLITIWMHFANKGAGVYYCQERPGKGDQIFKVIKFKSMTDEKDIHGTILPAEKRLTKIGNFLRKTSIDELPQLINVLKGEMSIVGPRPLFPSYLPFYTEIEKKRHNVRPGITGWAQVNGRNNLNWDKRLLFDVYYVDNISFGLDLKIILKSIQIVLKQKDLIVIPGIKGKPLNVERYENAKNKCE